MNIYGFVHTVNAKCPICGKTFARTDEWVFAVNHRYYCSRKCFKAREIPPDEIVRQIKAKAEARNKTRYLQKDEKSEIVRLYDMGLGYNKIADIMGRSDSAVKYAIREHYGTYVPAGKR